jgi:nucleotidyltransferase AbiEii toxin of type IV toxin-antitoxin system
VTELPRKDKPPHNVNVLGRWLTEASQLSGIAAGRLRRWLGFMVVAAMLGNARRVEDGQPLFLIKGGVAMELRFGSGARATRDLDAALRAPIDTLADHLHSALRAGFGEFTATRTEIDRIRDTGAVRCSIRISYRNKPVVTVPVEVAEIEGSMDEELDIVPAAPLDHLGLEGPEAVPCLAVRWQIAQKLHACTEQVPGAENDRFRDLLDLQLLGSLVADDEWPRIRAACLEIFEGRGAHAWPPDLAVPDAWDAGYRALSEETGFSVVDIDEAATTVRALISRIASS